MGSAPTKQSSCRTGEKLRVKFILSEVIGKGGFGRVYSAFHLDSKEWFALKQTNIRQVLDHKNGLVLLISELYALRRVIRHSCVVGLNAAFHDDRFCYMALDLCTGGDLRYHLNKHELFCEKRTAFITACIASALRHCHQRGVLHRDIKPENILINEKGYALLTDFGVSFSSDSHRTHPNGDLICHLASGTRQYLAPEAFTSSHTHGCASDFWSLGVVTFELTYGQRPFPTHCPLEYIHYAQNHLPDSDGTYITPPCCISSTGTRVGGFVDEGCSLHHMSKRPDAPLTETGGLRRMHFPKISSVNGHVSASCRRLLKNLLSVNQSRRYGHGERNFLQLQRSSWFEECGVSWSGVNDGTAQSPYRPDLLDVGKDLCQAFAGEFSGHTLSSTCSTCGDAAVMSSGNSVTDHSCGHSRRVLGSETSKALEEFFFLAPEYCDFDPAHDETWQSRSKQKVGHTLSQVHGQACGISNKYTEGSSESVRTVPMRNEVTGFLSISGAPVGKAMVCH